MGEEGSWPVVSLGNAGNQINRPHQRRVSDLGWEARPAGDNPLPCASQVN